MSTTLDLRVEVEKSVHQVPGLSESVVSASRFLESRVQDSKLRDLRDLSLSWQYYPIDGGRVEVSLRASWEFDNSSQTVHPIRVVPVKDLLDPVSQKVWMWRLWGDVLEQASAMQLRHIDEQIQELEKAEREEEANAR